MRILVTGGAGFIGSHVAEAYARLGRGKEHAKWQPATVSVLLDGKNEDSFVLKVESSGVLRPKEIVTKAVEILEEKLKEMQKEVSAKVE